MNVHQISYLKPAQNSTPVHRLLKHAHNESKAHGLGHVINAW